MTNTPGYYAHTGLIEAYALHTCTHYVHEVTNSHPLEKQVNNTYSSDSYHLIHFQKCLIVERWHISLLEEL